MALGDRAARTHLSSLLTVSCHVRISRVEPLPRDIFLVPVRVEVRVERGFDSFRDDTNPE